MADNRFPFSNPHENGSENEDGNTSEEDNHSILFEEMEIIEDVLWELEALMQILSLPIDNTYLVEDLLWEFEELLQILENVGYMSLEVAFIKANYLLQEGMAMMIADTIDDVADVLLEEPFEDCFIEANDFLFSLPEFEE